jgi:hypothetical protein
MATRGNMRVAYNMAMRKGLGYYRKDGEEYGEVHAGVQESVETRNGRGRSHMRLRVSMRGNDIEFSWRTNTDKRWRNIQVLKTVSEVWALDTYSAL